MAHKNKTNYSPYKARQEQRQKGLGGTTVTTSAPQMGKHKKPETIYELNEANDRLADVFRNHGFDMVSHQQRQQLAHFYRLLM
ncbi:MAG TPA: 16S rRNA (guanine(527)-N(7))-methyltransferase RsmG, partial [Bdellovibrio sp.]